MRNSDALRIGRHQLKTFEKRQRLRYPRNTVRIHSALFGDNYLQISIGIFSVIVGNRSRRSLTALQTVVANRTLPERHYVRVGGRPGRFTELV